jgi:hypothetical protein
VTNSFQPQDYSITSSDVVTIDLSDTITLTSSYDNAIGYSAMTTSTGTHNVAIGAGSTYTITSGGGGGTFAGITAQDISTFNWKMPEEFVDAFPDYDRVKKMCEQYPGLKLAYDKFVTTYKLVRDDYDLPPEKRIKP